MGARRRVILRTRRLSRRAHGLVALVRHALPRLLSARSARRFRSERRVCIGRRLGVNRRPIRTLLGELQRLRLVGLGSLGGLLKLVLALLLGFGQLPLRERLLLLHRLP